MKFKANNGTYFTKNFNGSRHLFFAYFFILLFLCGSLKIDGIKLKILLTAIVNEGNKLNNTQYLLKTLKLILFELLSFSRKKNYLCEGVGFQTVTSYFSGVYTPALH